MKMKNVRKDVRRKLFTGLAEKKLACTGARYFEYDTPRAKHYVRMHDGYVTMNSIYYNGEQRHTREELKQWY